MKTKTTHRQRYLHIPPYKSQNIPSDAVFWLVEVGFKDFRRKATSNMFCWTPPGVHIFDLLEEIETLTINSDEEMHEYMYLPPELLAEKEITFDINSEGWMIRHHGIQKLTQPKTKYRQHGFSLESKNKSKH